MNEITRIHLARTPYEIDVAAKKELEKYMSDIRKSLGRDEDIIDDIEIRMTEILGERGIEANGIITESDVAAIRSQLGEPRDFASDDQPVESAVADEPIDRPNKKFYRDEDNSILGGVAAGLAAYTGWDVALIRIAFVVFAFISFGWAVLIYLIVWIVAPAAQSTGEKLEMRGEPVNLDSIKDAAQKVSVRASEVGQEAAAKVGQAANEVRRNSKRGVHVLGRALMIAFGACVAVASAAAFLASVYAAVVILVRLSEIQASGWLTVATVTSLIAAIALATAWLVLATALIVGKFRRSHGLTLLITTIICVLMTTAAGGIISGWYAEVGHDQAAKTWREVVEPALNKVHCTTNEVRIDENGVTIPCLD